MFIKSLTLSNIRSYESETISFSSGTTLLSGDIGSGKTTILIALEYALFGLLRGKTQPAELLRHSADEGSITLHVEIAGKDVHITRGLKRGKSAIGQTPGVLVVDGIEETYVTTELKAKVLELLGYPESLLAKSTNLFRYTVYTPQEQVKHILHESVEERKDIVRKIFGIDKYKRVVENTTPYVGDLRERIAAGKVRVDDVKILKEQLVSSQKELQSIAVGKKPVEESFAAAQVVTKVKKEELEAKKKIRDEQRTRLQEQKLKAEKLVGTRKLLELLHNEQSALKKRIEDAKIEEIVFDKEKKVKILDALEQLAQKNNILNKKYGELSAKESQSTEIQSQILELTTCPTCQQEVGSDHKTHISHIQSEIMSGVATKRKEYDELAFKIKEKEKKLRVRLGEEQELEKKQYNLLQQKKQVDVDKKRLDSLLSQITIKQKEISDVEAAQKTDKEIKIINIELEEQAYELARRQEQQLALSLREQTTRESETQKQVQRIIEELARKEQIAKEVGELMQTRTWIQELFIPLVRTIEKRVLLNIYAEFNTYFTQWFSMLIDDESLSVRLDEDFTPLIEQHGYDTLVGNLSGGEKTSVALAYRLALNKVLNDYFSSLHTKGLLILDEPTDGFSSQQLDKLRDVLDEIGVMQVIIVSHEQKLESVADHLIYVHKDSGVSKISQSRI